MDAVLVIVVMFATLLAAALTVPAGFGLATMLTPVCCCGSTRIWPLLQLL